MPTIPPSPLVVSALPTTITITAAQFNAGTYGNGANEAYVQLNAPLSGYVGWEPTYGTTITTTIYRGAGLTTLQGPGSAIRGWFAPILDGTVYYVWLRKGSAIASDITVTLSARQAPTLTPGVTLVVNDDSAQFSDHLSYLPATVMDTTGVVLGFIDGPPAGELMAALPTGETIWHDRFVRYGTSLSVFDATYALVASIDTTPALGAGNFPRLGHDGTNFWVFRTANLSLYTVSPLGVVSGILASLARVPQAFNVLGTTLSWVENSSAYIHQHDLATNTPLPDIGPFPDPAGDISRVAQTPNGHPGDLLTLPDGSIVTWYSMFGVGFDVLIHLDATGAVLHRYPYDRNLLQIDHLDYAEAQSDSIAVWWLDNTTSFATGRFARVSLADGAEIWGFDTPLFSVGINEYDTLPFGPSGSCDFVLFNYGANNPLPPPPPPVTFGQGCPTQLPITLGPLDPGCAIPFFP